MNISILKMVVTVIGAMVILALCMVGLLIINDKPVPDIFQITIVSGFTGLLGLLAPSKDATNPDL